jgi:hypothetical protein
MVAAITLRSEKSSLSNYIYSPSPGFNSTYVSAKDSNGKLRAITIPNIPVIDFGTSQMAFYKVKPESSSANEQEYVVVVSEGPQYYYVNGSTGRDDWPDYYNGGSESYPFKTLAKAVHAASRSSSINKIFVSGELNAATEKGAWGDVTDDNGFHPSGGNSDSVFNLIGTNNRTITVSGVNNAVLRGTSGKRVLSITGGANITFENITVTGGDTAKVGGGVYIEGDCKVKFSGCTITGNKAASGGGVYVHGPDSGSADGEFYFIGGSISGNTATGTAAGSIANPAAAQGGGGLYLGGRIAATLYNATVANNTAQGGSGGGVLIAAADPNNNSGNRDSNEFGLFMFGGSISQNNSYGYTSPHGGGGVYVAQGAFDMDGGNISGNYSKRQGGGVFIWHNARFSASGNSSILNNDGVGSSKAICSRGYTLLTGNARADKIYIWNNNDSPKFSREPDSFTISENARADGIVLAYDDSDSGAHQTRNHINVANLSGIDTVATIDLEGHLTDNAFKTMDLEGDWLGKTLIKSSIASISTDIARFPLGTFVGSGTRSLSSYKIVPDGVYGKMQHR